MLIKSIQKLYRPLAQHPGAGDDLKELKHKSARALLWLMVLELIMVGQVYPTKYFVDGLVARSSSRHLMTIIGVSLTAYLLGTRFKGAMDNRRHSSMWFNVMVLWGYGHWHQLKQDAGWHTAHSTGEKESVLSRNVMKVDRLTDAVIFNALPLVTRIMMTGLGVGLFIGWIYGLVAIATTVLYFAIMAINEPFFRKQRKESRQEMKKIEIDGAELTTNWRTIKHLGLEDEQALEQIALLRDFCHAEDVRHAKWQKRVRYQQDLVSLSRAVLWVVLVFSTKGQLSNAQSIGTTVLAMGWMERIYSNFGNLDDFQRALNEGVQASHELTVLFETIPGVKQPELPQWPEAPQGHIEIIDMAFGYPNTDTPALCDIDLTIKPGQTVAFVGKSGGGKSTLAHLLLRDYDPTTGSIVIDGIPLDQIDYLRYRREVVAVVSQDVQLADCSIMENIRRGRTDATDDEVVHAAKLAYAHDFIVGFGAGYETLVGENGIRLSGGQKQRLAIARALIRRPTILILDEATSALDSDSQRKVKSTIDSQGAGNCCTIIVVAHRWSTIENADVVVVFDQGRIVQVGTHEELSAQIGSIYCQLKEGEGKGILE